MRRELPEPITAQEMFLADIAESLRLLVAAKSADVVQEPNDREPVELTSLPDDFPGRDALVSAGFWYVEHVPNAMRGLTAINGIGPATAARIIETLEALGE